MSFVAAAETWDKRYDSDDFHFGHLPNQYLVQQHHWLPKGRTLCVADGEGRNSVWLAQQGHSVCGFDISATGVEKARRLAASTGVSLDLRVCSWEAFDWEAEAFDAVVAIFIQFVGPQERRQLFEQMAKCLKPGGRLLVQGYTPKQLEYKTGGPGQRENLYEASTLPALLPGFMTRDLCLYEAVLAEGEGHKGPSALLGYVGEKPSA